MKELLKQIWMAEAKANDNMSACRFQTDFGGVTETWVNSRALLYDYAPEEKLQPDQLFTVADLPLKNMEDLERTYAENMFYPGELILEDYELLGAMFLNDGLPEHGQAISAYSLNGKTGYYKCSLPWGNETSFQWVRKLLYYIPTPVQDLVRDCVTLRELGASLIRLKATPDLALLFRADSLVLLVTLSRMQPKELVNEQLFVGQIQYRLDGWNSETRAFTRLVEVKSKSMPVRGLANPTRAAAANAAPPVPPKAVPDPIPQEAPTPQVEEVQPEQAEQIAQQAPEPIQEPVEDSTSSPEEESKKRTRTRKAPTAATPANAKALDEVIAYLGSPPADSMTQEEIDEEIRKCRDLGIVLSRRMANLYAAGTLIPKRKLAAVRDVLN